MNTLNDRLVIAISSRALFDLKDSDQVYRKEGLTAYSRYQIDHEEEVLEPGDAFPLVRKLLGLNSVLKKERVEVILLSRNTADTGLRVFNSIEHHNLGITRAAFCGGNSPYRYAAAFGCHLFLSTDSSDAACALEHGIAAATLLNSPATEVSHPQLRIAFDGDAVLFSDEAERIYQEGGLDAFQQAEQKNARSPLGGGPFKPFLEALQRIQQEWDDRPEADKLSSDEAPPIRTALVTARSAPAHERVVRTLRDWNIRLDESIFLGGLSKTGFLQAFGADVFFDDQVEHCAPASRHLTTGHVPVGSANERRD